MYTRNFLTRNLVYKYIKLLEQIPQVTPSKALEVLYTYTTTSNVTDITAMDATLSELKYNFSQTGWTNELIAYAHNSIKLTIAQMIVTMLPNGCSLSDEDYSNTVTTDVNRYGGVVKHPVGFQPAGFKVSPTTLQIFHRLHEKIGSDSFKSNLTSFASGLWLDSESVVGYSNDERLASSKADLDEIAKWVYKTLPMLADMDPSYKVYHLPLLQIALAAASMKSGYRPDSISSVGLSARRDATRKYYGIDNTVLACMPYPSPGLMKVCSDGSGVKGYLSQVAQDYVDAMHWLGEEF